MTPLQIIVLAGLGSAPSVWIRFDLIAKDLNAVLVIIGVTQPQVHGLFWPESADCRRGRVQVPLEEHEVVLFHAEPELGCSMFVDPELERAVRELSAQSVQHALHALDDLLQFGIRGCSGVRVDARTLPDGAINLRVEIDRRRALHRRRVP